MSKPWDKEKTPITDMLTDDEDGFCCGIHDFQDLERRMRAAERLLEHALEHCGRSFTAQNIKVHLEAARKEDGR